MAKQYRIVRKITSIPITANGFETRDLPMDYDYEAIGFRISANLQVTVLATSVRNEAPVQLVPRVEVVADGKNNIVSAPFWSLCQGNWLRSMKDENGRAATPPSGVAVATYAVEALGIADLIQPDSARPKDTAFRSRGLSLLQVRLTFGAAGDAFVGGTVNFTGTNVVDVYALQIVEEMKDGQFIDKPIGLTKTSFQEAALTASNANFEIDLPAGNLIRACLFRFDGGTTAGEPDATILNNLTLQNGIDVRWNLSGANTRALNNAQIGKWNVGYYLADFMLQGQGGQNLMGNLWDLSGRTQPKAVLDVVGGGNRKVQVVTREILQAA